MTTAAPSCTSFSIWLGKYLTHLSDEIDIEVYGDYIEGLLNDETLDKPEIIDSIRSFLESVLPSELAIEGSETIFTRFHDLQVTPSAQSPTTAATNTTASEHFDRLEEQMRSILISTVVANTTTPVPSYVNPFPPRNSSTKLTNLNTQGEKNQPQGKQESQLQKQRDACTVAVLRAAGATGYQGDAEAEAALKVALADAEYFAKQVANGGGISPSATTASKGGKTGLGVDVVAAAIMEREEEIDLEEIEEKQGYAKKEGIKPGNVMDALSTLNPGKFSSSDTAVAAAEDFKSSRHLKRMPTPGDVNSSSTPGYLLLNSRSTGSSVGGAANTSFIAGAGAANIPKKKSAPPSKHLADIGARAEEKHQRMMAKQQERLSAVGVGGTSGNRLDDMDAFFFSDDEDDVEARMRRTQQRKKEEDVLHADGGKRERVIEAEKLNRVISAREYAESRAKAKAERAGQEEENAKRKVVVHQRTQKLERRRH
ncbi:unnamed protein product [Hydatigera taeniaeformis]|uniref:Coiled-coil domain-containing protein 43 n=1 Tax=Hydatigena taeniaeformis TaxID=6205 RepID=A0A0R3X4K5_HYDTA|nr:unnamed protein product [Hydatigera taeniaeformis]